METFKERMKRIRIRAGYKSQQEAATAIGCERGTVGMWEAPSSLVSSLSEEYLFAVSRAYRVKPEWINQLDNKHDGYPLGGRDTQVLRSERESSSSEPAGDGPSFFDDLPRSYYEAPSGVRSAIDKLLDTSPKNTTHREALARMIHAYYETQKA